MKSSAEWKRVVVVRRSGRGGGGIGEEVVTRMRWREAYCIGMKVDAIFEKVGKVGGLGGWRLSSRHRCFEEDVLSEN